MKKVLLVLTVSFLWGHLHGMHRIVVPQVNKHASLAYTQMRKASQSNSHMHASEDGSKAVLAGLGMFWGLVGACAWYDHTQKQKEEKAQQDRALALYMLTLENENAQLKAERSKRCLW